MIGKSETFTDYSELAPGPYVVGSNISGFKKIICGNNEYVFPVNVRKTATIVIPGKDTEGSNQEKRDDQCKIFSDHLKIGNHPVDMSLVDAMRSYTIGLGQCHSTHDPNYRYYPGTDHYEPNDPNKGKKAFYGLHISYATKDHARDFEL